MIQRNSLSCSLRRFEFYTDQVGLGRWTNYGALCKFVGFRSESTLAIEIQLIQHQKRSAAFLFALSWRRSHVHLIPSTHRG